MVNQAALFNNTFWPGVALLFGYAIGSAPVAWLLVRRRHGVDLRTTGSGTGAVAAMQVGGLRTAIWALLLEALKGGIVGVCVRVAGGPAWVAALAIAGCVVGDAFPVIGWRRGGRGVVPLVSGLLIALPVAGLITALVGFLSVAMSRRGAGLVGMLAVAVPIGLVVGTGSWLSLIAAAIIVAVLLVRVGLPGRTQLASAAPRIVV